MDIDDHNKADKRFYINFSGNNIIKGKVGRDVAKPADANHTATCSRWFGFGGKQDAKNTGRTVVTIDGIKVFEDGHMVSHEINTEHDKYTDGYKDNAYSVTEWEINSQKKRYMKKRYAILVRLRLCKRAIVLLTIQQVEFRKILHQILLKKKFWILMYSK